jgi:glycolate oxidase FAD binding subunit
MNLQPDSMAELQDTVRARPALAVRGGGTKPALSTPVEQMEVLSTAGLSGVLEYEPGEFTFTALAGTPVTTVQAVLAEHGQYLPFDPPLAAQGATLGGVVAAGTSGPGRLRFGGVRDFIIGVRFVDGQGDLVRGGGKVVKNAAGFDLPKLMVGSLGRLGVLAELTFKVFPQPAAYTTLQLSYPTLAAAVDALRILAAAPLDLDALDLLPATGDEPPTLWVRLGGLADALPPRVVRLRTFFADRVPETTGLVEWSDGAAADLWAAARDFAWVPVGWSLLKIPITPARIVLLEEQLAGREAVRRYSVAGNLAWLAWPEDPAALHDLLASLGLAALVLWGPPGRPLLGKRAGEPFARRVKQALDPTNRFGEV